MQVTIQKNKKLNSVMSAVAILFLTMFFINIFLNGSKHYAEELNVELYTVEDSILLGESTTLQVFVYNQDFSYIENAKITISLNDKLKKAEPIKQKLQHVENGLYETKVQFLQVGNWDGKINITKGNLEKEKDVMLTVEKF